MNNRTGGNYLQNMKKGGSKLEVVYNVSFKYKNNLIKTDEELEDIITKKLLKVILNLENNTSVALNNS